MRIAIAIEKFDPAAGGNERSTEQIARRLIERGHEVTIFTARGRPDVLPTGRVIASDGIDPKYAVGLLAFRRWATRRMDAGQFDVTMSVGMAVPAHIVQPRQGTARQNIQRKIDRKRGELRKALTWMQIFTRPKLLTWWACERRTLSDPRVKKVAAISQYVADQFFHYYTLPSRRLAMIHNAAEVPAMKPAHRQQLREHTRKALNVEPSDVLFFFAAMNPKLKGIDALLEATRQVYPQQPRVKVALAGSLPRPPASQVDDALRWVGPTRQVHAMYAAADVTVLPTWYDPSSKVVLESLLHGVPAISTLHNGASQWIYDPAGERAIPSPFEYSGDNPLIMGQAGRIIRSPRDVDALAEAMLQLCDDEVRAECSEATQGLPQRIDMDRHVDQLEALMRELASS